MFVNAQLTIKEQIITSLVSVFIIGAVAVPRVAQAVKDDFQEPIHHKVAQGDGFFPWDTETGFPSGFSTDILEAVCDANVLMDCEVVFDPLYANCIDVDNTAGPNLLDDEIVGCLTWFRTDERLLNGLTPTAAYSGTEVGGDGTTVMTYPPAMPVETQSFIENFNCGLSLIAANGTYDEICRDYDGGDTTSVPFCFDASEIAQPSKECEKLEDKSSS